MADFYPILARAVAGLPDNSPETRRAIYDRARAALVAQLRGLDPPLGEAEIMRERLTLDEAVARIEAEYDETAAPPQPGRGPVIRPQEPAAQPPRPPAPKQQPEFAPLPPADGRENTGEPFDEPLPEPPENQPARPRILPPREPRVKPGHIRTVVVGVVVAVAVAAIAGTAIYVHKLKPQDTPRPSSTAAQQEQQPAQPDNAGKIADRVGEPSAPAPSGRPGGVAGGNAPGTPVPQPGGEVAVAQRAILYVETPENPQQPRTVTGRVLWRLDSESAGQGRPVETIVRASVEIPEVGLNLDFTIRRNTDSAFPASHILGMRFTVSGDPATQAIKEVGVPQLKTAEGERGAPLSAINSALGDNLFVAALSNVPVEVERNTDLILNRSWFDVPVLFTSGRRGIITFEKGVSGSQTLADAFGRWQ